MDKVWCSQQEKKCDYLCDNNTKKCNYEKRSGASYLDCQFLTHKKIIMNNKYIIVSQYLDGEIKEILGYADNEEEAIKQVSKLTKQLGLKETYNYSYEIVGKLKDIEK